MLLVDVRPKLLGGDAGLNDCRNNREINRLRHDVDAVLAGVLPRRVLETAPAGAPPGPESCLSSEYWPANSSPKPLDAPVIAPMNCLLW